MTQLRFFVIYILFKFLIEFIQIKKTEKHKYIKTFNNSKN